MWNRKKGIERHLKAISEIDARHKELSTLEASAGIPQGRNDLYSSADDPEIRARLIKKADEIELLIYEDARQEALDARRALEKAHRVGTYWYISAAVEGAALVIISYWLYDLPGSIAGAVAALFFGRGIEQAYKKQRRTAIMSAIDDLKWSKEKFDELTAKRQK